MQSKHEPVFPVMFEFGRLIRRQRGVKQELTLPQLETLYYAAGAKEPLMRDVASYLRVTAPSATALIEDLTKHGYLVRSSNPNDRRQVRVQITSRGKKVLNAHMARKARAIERILGVLSKKDRADFIRILRIVVTSHK